MSRTLRPDQWEGLPEHVAEAGTVLFRAGDVSSSLVVLVSGTIDVWADGALLARLDEPGTIVGEMAGLLGCPRTATVVASTPITYRQAPDVVALMAEKPDVGMAIARTLAHRLRLVQAHLSNVRREVGEAFAELDGGDAVIAALASAPPLAVDSMVASGWTPGT